ncbi:MAG: transcription termination factor Rho [Puniceicoccales bacterium]|jgi:transcription termination factor Rho|nr:transcription termination factor Rho [Puniceicoccales bacterium]
MKSEEMLPLEAMRTVVKSPTYRRRTTKKETDVSSELPDQSTLKLTEVSDKDAENLPSSVAEKRSRLVRGHARRVMSSPSESSAESTKSTSTSSGTMVSPARRAMFQYSDLSQTTSKEEWSPQPCRVSDILTLEERSSPSLIREDKGVTAAREFSSVASRQNAREAKMEEDSGMSTPGDDVRRDENVRRSGTNNIPNRRPNAGNANGSGGNSYRPNGDMRRPNSSRPPTGARTLRIGSFSLGGLRNLDIFRRRDSLENVFTSVFQETGKIFDLMQAYAQTQVQLLKFVEESALLSEDRIPSRSRILDVCMMQALEEGTPIRVQGVLEFVDNGDGVMVYAQDSFRIQAKSAFVPRCLIQSYGLRRGQNLTAYIHPPKEQSSCPFVLRIIDVMGLAMVHPLPILPKFKELTPCYPTERLLLESPEAVTWDNLSMRVVDLLTPIGLGQRGLIVAPPRTGKTILLQHIANAIVKARPDAHVMILLIDERPEEVTDFARHVPAEVISSTFDESADNHVTVADMAIENARRRVEAGQHVVILLDSITRLARAYNTRQPSSGKILSGGVEANALQEPKCFFGAARNIEGGGSLTILATALIETGSRMDDVIFEEFKGTGNMELHLDRALVEKRIFPAINFEKSGTRREELLYHPDEMEKIYTLRRALKGVPSTEAMEMLISRLKKTRSNVEFLLSVNR